MSILTYAKSKKFMLDWLKNESKQDIVSVIDIINDGNDFDFLIPVSGSKSDLIYNLSDVPKRILWDAIDQVFPDIDADDEDEDDDDDWVINNDSSKNEMLDWLEDEPREEILSVINLINDGNDYDYKLNISGTKNDLINELLNVPKNVIWNAIDEVFPDCDSDDEDEDEENSDQYDKDKPSGSRQSSKKSEEFNLVQPRDIALNSFDLKILNLDQDPDQLLRRIENFYKLRSSDFGFHNLTVLLSGPSGAGKTHLIRFLSKRLNKPVMFLSASSFLSKYVGETEQNTKKIFEYAEKHDCIVFIDEIEGLLQSRASADNSWELTQINELLVRLEKFKGVCIGATNLYQSLDAAFYRRFTLKIEFSFMKKEVRWQYVKNKFYQILNSEMDSGVEELLKNIEYLTPGDIESVYRRLILDGVKYSGKAIVKEIEREVSLKKHVFQKKINLK